MALRTRRGVSRRLLPLDRVSPHMEPPSRLAFAILAVALPVFALQLSSDYLPLSQ